MFCLLALFVRVTFFSFVLSFFFSLLYRMHLFAYIHGNVGMTNLAIKKPNKKKKKRFSPRLLTMKRMKVLIIALEAFFARSVQSAPHTSCATAISGMRYFAPSFGA